jgi:hypothetical protein
MSVLLGQTVSASWQKHLADREVRRAEQNRLVEQALVITDEIENNCRAALGLQLNACVANQSVLEGSVKGLRANVLALTKVCQAHGAAFDQLTNAVSSLGSLSNHLKETDASLSRLTSTMTYIEQKLGEE